MIKKILFLLFLTFSFCFDGFGQGTSCATATVLTVNGTCGSGTIQDSNENAPLYSSSGCTGTFRREGWYSFTVSGGPLDITVESSGNRNLAMQIISGNCASPTQIACANDLGGTGANYGTETYTGTLGNGTYFVKVLNVGGNQDLDLDSICITSAGGGSNDDCSGAVALSVSPSTVCTTSQSGTTVGATQSIPAITCGGFSGNADDDVWYSFVATSTTHTITVTQGTLADPVIDLRSGACNGTSIDCSDSTIGTPEILTANGLTIGNTYYIRVYSYSGATAQGTFDICVTTPPAPTDPCSSITNIASCGTNVNTTFTSGNGIYSPGACGWTTPGTEQIFSFTPTVTGSYSIQQNSSFGYIDYFYKIAGTCNGTGWTCIDDMTGASTSGSFTLTVGNTYYFMLDPEGTGGGNVSFNITCPPPPLTNDDPCTAEPLTIGGTCNYSTYTTLGATATAGVPAPGCAGYSGGDVWFTVTVPANGTIMVDTQTGSMTDSGMAFYSAASCSGPFTLIECDDDDSPNGLMSSIMRSGLTPGSTLYIRVWEYNNDNQGSFGICVTSPDDPCTTPTTLSCGDNLSGTTVGTPNFPSSMGCAMGSYGAYYTFVGDGQYTTISSTASFDHEMAIASGSCGSFTNIACVDSALSAGTETYGFVTSLGVTYYVYISSWDSGSTTTGTFNISRTCVPVTPPPNDLCADAEAMACGDTVNGSTLFATNLPHGLNCTAASDYGVWYTFTGTGEQTIITAVPQASYNIRMTVASGTCGSLTNVTGGCFDNGGIGVQEQFVFNSVLGTTYYVYISANGAASTATGSFSLSISCCEGDIDPTPTCDVVAGGLGLDGADPAPINCSAGGCVDLEVDYLAMGNTNSYRVEKIPYNPPPTGALLPITGLTDDTFSNTIAMPWDFCFYGTTYSNFVFGANGVISFDSARLAGTASGYITNYNIPTNNNSSGYYFGPSIYGVHHDIDPSVGGIIGRTIDNTPGCERMIIVWEDVPMFFNNNILYSGKMVLYKDSNIIEVHIEEKRIDGGSWNNGHASVALQRDSAEGIAAPCRNTLDPNWTVTSGEAWRFVPDDGDITSVTWYEGSGTSGPVVANTAVVNVCPAATTTYTAAVTYTPACGAPFTKTDEVVVTVGDKVWNGSVDTNWFVDNNWTPTGVPTDTDCVVIPDISASNNRSPIADILATPPLPPDPALARNVSVRNNGSLTVNADTYLEIGEWLNVQPNGEVLIRNSGSLIQLDNPAINNNTGNIRMQREASGVTNLNYVYWSSPVEGFNVENINTAASELRWEWDPTVDGIHNGIWIPASGPMALGKGYIVRGLATPPPPIPADNAEFMGRPNNGIINVPITRGTYTGGPYTAVGGGDTDATAIDDNWNLIGNPYPSAVSADAFITTNASQLADNGAIIGTIYLWQRQGTPSSSTDPFYGDYVYNYMDANYVAYNPTGPNPPEFSGSIAAGQSFFIQMDDGAGINNTVTFDNTMRHRTLANNNFLRTGERHRIWLDLINASERAISTLVGYVDGATNDKDLLYDGHNLSEANMKLYSLIEDEKMTIQGRMLPFDSEDRVPLGMVVPEMGIYKIAINSVDGLFNDPSQDIYLEDTYLGIIHDLRSSPYLFSTGGGEFNDRFILRYTDQALSTPEEVASFGFNIIGVEDYIKVTSGRNPISSVIIYDVLGRILADYHKINALEFKINLENMSNGTLIVKATLDNGQQKIKKVVH